MKRIIAVDFDGTIAEHIYPEVGTLKPHAKDVINHLYNMGHKIIIWTCRYGQPAELAKEALKEWGIKYHTFNEHLPEVKEMFGNDTRKVMADVYIDDRNLGGIPDWLEIRKILKIKHNI